MSAPRRRRRTDRAAAADPPPLPAPRDLVAHRLEAGGTEFVVFEWPTGAARLPSALTDAERAVAELAIAGHGNAEIARRRGVSVRTIANQLAAIFQKLGVGSRAELVGHLLHLPASTKE